MKCSFQRKQAKIQEERMPMACECVIGANSHRGANSLDSKGT